MRLYSYVIDHDLGFAPNPFFRVCSLACCKPQIRKFAKEGDFVIGTGSTTGPAGRHLVYWMQINRILTFDQYWRAPEYFRKRPILSGSDIQRYGDNIYCVDRTTNEWVQEDSFHSGTKKVENLKRDTGATDRVLLGETFAYWGGEGPELPQEFQNFVHIGVGHSVGRFKPADVQVFSQWLLNRPERGCLSNPTDWEH